MNKEKVVQFLEQSGGDTWADEMQWRFHEEHGIINKDKWDHELFSCVKLANMIKTGKLDVDVKNFLLDSRLGSTWSDDMNDAYVETFDDFDDYDVLTCDIILSFFE